MLDQFKRLLGHLYGCLHDPDVISLEVKADGSVWVYKRGRAQRLLQTLDCHTRQRVLELVQGKAFNVDETLDVDEASHIDQVLLFDDTLSYLNNARFFGYYEVYTHQPIFQISWYASFE